MKKYIWLAIVLAVACYSETLFEVKDSSNNKVLDVSTDGIRVMNLGDTLMVISSSEIKANLDNSKGLSRSFSVSTTTSKGTGTDLMKLTGDSTRFWISDTGSGFGVSKGSALKGVNPNLLEVSTSDTKMREGTAGEKYTDFSPDNIFIGLKSGINTTPGTPSGLYGINNIFIGNEAGLSTTQGYDNIMIGDSVGVSNTTGFFNVFLGNSAGFMNQSGHRNVFIGYEAGYANNTRPYNTYIGSYAGRNSTGFENTYIGCLSGTMNSTGNDNTCLGFWSGYSNQSGDFNSILGSGAGLCNNGGDGNTIMGFLSGAGEIQTNNSYNSLFGFKAGYTINTGSNNVMIGSESGYSNISGTGNVFLGYKAGYNETASNKLYIANSNTSTPLIKGTFPNTDLTFKASTIILDGTINGNLNTSSFANNYFRISSTSPGICGIDLFRSGASYRDWRIYNTGGNFIIGVSTDDLATVVDKFQIDYMTGNVGIGSTSPGQKFDIYGGNGRVESGYSWLTSSDKRFKKNITTLDNALVNVKKMRGVRYDLNEEKDTVQGQGKYIGFIAQEVEEVYDELVVEDHKGYKSVAYDKVNAILVEAIKEQQTEIDELKKRLNDLEKKFSSLK
jgi:trimeric autotransporter adhesin